jgi:SAM-dependent methyltransferase
MTNLDATVTLLQTLGDPSRVRLLSLLSSHELSVAELVAVTELTQSRVSTHLAKLREVGLLRVARDAGQTRYGVDEAALSDPARKLWSAVADELDDTRVARDRKRAEEAVRARASGSRWSERVAGEMERHWSPGRTWESAARGLAMMLALGDVLDVGSGDGTIAELIAPRARSVVCLDRSEKVVAAARARLAGQPHTRAIVGDASALPCARASFDVVLLFHVLTLVAHPNQVIAEAARVLRPGGVLLIATLDAHDRADVVAPFEHRHLGFRPAALRKLLTAEKLQVEACDVGCLERRPPHFGVVIARASKPASKRASEAKASASTNTKTRPHSKRRQEIRS